eukprot:s254_g27.t1
MGSQDTVRGWGFEDAVAEMHVGQRWKSSSVEALRVAAAEAESAKLLAQQQQEDLRKLQKDYEEQSAQNKELLESMQAQQKDMQQLVTELGTLRGAEARFEAKWEKEMAQHTSAGGQEWQLLVGMVLGVGTDSLAALGGLSDCANGDEDEDGKWGICWDFKKDEWSRDLKASRCAMCPSPVMQRCLLLRPHHGGADPDTPVGVPAQPLLLREGIRPILSPMASNMATAPSFMQARVPPPPPPPPPGHEGLFDLPFGAPPSSLHASHPDLLPMELLGRELKEVVLPDPKKKKKKKERHPGAAACREVRDEISAEIDVAVSKPGSILQKADFDSGVRRYLGALRGCQNGKQKVKDAMAMLHHYTAQKMRSAVKNWPAYLLTLLKRFEPGLLSKGLGHHPPQRLRRLDCQVHLTEGR